MVPNDSSLSLNDDAFRVAEVSPTVPLPISSDSISDSSYLVESWSDSEALTWFNDFVASSVC